MMRGYDNWHSKKADILQLYRLGRDVGTIAGLTGTPKIRIERELARTIETDKTLEQRHLQAQYPKRRRMLRFSAAVIVLSNNEHFRAVNEY